MGNAAVDGDDLSRDEAGCVGCEENHGAGYVFGNAFARQEDMTLDHRQLFGGHYLSGPPADPACEDKFTLAPPDVLNEIHSVLNKFGPTKSGDATGESYPYKLTSRRLREVCNSSHRNVPEIRKRVPVNYAYMNPDDLASLGLGAGAMVEISSDAGCIPAAVHPDPTVRRGVVSMTHGWGNLPDETDYERDGSNTNLLISTDRDIEPIVALPRMSAIPVAVTPVRT